MPRITESVFRDVLKEKLGDLWERGQTLFRNYGENLQWDVTNILMHASNKGKVSEVLALLEEHYTSFLQFQHPEIRGILKDAIIGRNPTDILFCKICEEVLELQPTAF